MIDPYGGIWTLWPLFGTSNQMLAAIALVFCTVVLFKMKRERFAWVTVVPAVWLVASTVTAGWQKVFSANPAVGFLAHAARFSDALAAGKVLAPASSLEVMRRVIFNDYLDATLGAVFAVVVVLTVIYGFIDIRKALGNPRSSAIEVSGAALAAGGSDD